MTVAIARTERDAAALSALASRDGDAKVARRLLALAMAMEGFSRTDAASATGMDRQTLRDWVHCYTENGVVGLADQPRAGGPEPKLNPEEKEQLAACVRQGPSLEEDGVVRWRLSDPRRRILERFFVILDERSVGRMLKACVSATSRCVRKTPKGISKRSRRTRPRSPRGERRPAGCASQAHRTLVAG